MLNFDFLEKSLEIVSPLHFMHDVSNKIFLILYYIILTDQILLPDCFDFFRY